MLAVRFWTSFSLSIFVLPQASLPLRSELLRSLSCCGTLRVKFVRLGTALPSDSLHVLWQASVLEELF